jgi:hypothetical protein
LGYKNAVKIKPFARMVSAISLGYERVINPNRSFEITAGYITKTSFLLNPLLGDQQGGFGTIAYKFGRKTAYGRIFCDGNPMLSPYATIAFSYSQYEGFYATELLGEYGSPYSQKIFAKQSSAVGTLTVGLQAILLKRFIFDVHFGAGTGWSQVETSHKDSEYDPKVYFSHFHFNTNNNLAIRTGFKLGYLF